MRELAIGDLSRHALHLSQAQEIGKMYGVGDARRTVAKPRERRVPAALVPCDQDDPGAHLCECYSSDLANSGRPARDYNSLPPHKRSRLC